MCFKHTYIMKIVLNYFAYYNGDINNKAKQCMNFKNYKQIKINTDTSYAYNINYFYNQIKFGLVIYKIVFYYI